VVPKPASSAAARLQGDTYYIPLAGFPLLDHLYYDSATTTAYFFQITRQKSGHPFACEKLVEKVGQCVEVWPACSAVRLVFMAPVEYEAVYTRSQMKPLVQGEFGQVSVEEFYVSFVGPADDLALDIDIHADPEEVMYMMPQ
jgi:hypothetical protein